MQSEQSPSSASSSTHPGFRQMTAVTVLLLLVAAALSVVFAQPTETLWYKMGADKYMLEAGQLAGLLTLALMVVQIVLALRPKWLQTTFGGGLLMAWHRINGMLMVGTALTHVVLVLVPEGLDNLPLGWRYKPEMVGAAVLLLLLVTVVFALLRTRLHLDFRNWRRWHRVAGYLLLILLTVHVLSVSSSFAGGIPRYGLLGVVALTCAMALWSWLHRSHR